MAEGEALCTLIMKLKKGLTGETDMKVVRINTGSDSHIESHKSRFFPILPEPLYHHTHFHGY